MKNMRKKKRNWTLYLVGIVMILYIIPPMFRLVDLNTITEGHGLVSYFYSAMDVLIFPIVFLGVVISIIDKTGIVTKILKEKNRDILPKGDETISNTNYKDRIQPYYAEAYGYVITMLVMYILIIILFFYMRFPIGVLILFLLGASVIAIIPCFKKDFMVIIADRRNSTDKETVKLISIKPYVAFANAHFERYSMYYRDASLGRYVLETSLLSGEKENTMYMYLSVDEAQLLKRESFIDIEYFTKANAIYKITEVKNNNAT